MADPATIGVSQLDITPNEDDNVRLKRDDWIATTPIITLDPTAHAMGLPLPKVRANPDEIYAAGSMISEQRAEMVKTVGKPDQDGVYCPVCHIANIDISKLQTPCPKCGRNLLRFGWT
jgi:hypothetical protein